MYFCDKLITLFRDADWGVEVKNLCSTKTLASPTGVVLAGAKVDLLPAYDTILDWCVLSTTNA